MRSSEVGSFKGPQPCFDWLDPDRPAMALLAPVLGQAPPRDELLATGGAGVARLLGQVLHLHVLDQVALVPD